jgi:hypothetical protein
VSRPFIVTTQADGTHIEREMDDLEFAEYEAKAKEMADHIANVHEKMEDRAIKLAQP